jgi:hypothetical protein
VHDLLTALRGLCLLRIGPQDLPYSPGLFGALVVANVLLDALVGALLGKLGEALTASLLTAAVTLGFVYLLLRINSRAARFVQTGTALAAAALVFSVLAVPAQVALTPMPTDPAALAPSQALALLGVVALGAWSLAVSAHILRNALERPFFHGLLMALAMNFSAALVVQAVLPQGAA